MFLGFQIPLSDGRRFFSANPNRLARPAWFNPQDQEFVRGFGSMQIRRRGGVRGLDFEHHYCNAAKLLRFPVPTQLSRQRMSTANGFFVPICVYRRFLSDGMNVARFELGLKNKNQIRNFSAPDCALLIQSLLNLKVCVAGNHGKQKQLGLCGADIARYYARSTTKVDHKEPSIAHSPWISPGRPLIIMESVAGELNQVTRSAFLVRRFTESGFTLFRDHAIQGNNLVGIWIIQFDQEEQISLPASRDLRICLSRLHAERECLKQALGLVAQEQTRAALALTSGAFQNYLKHAVGLLIRRQRYYGIEQSEILEAAQEFDALLSAGERETILRALEDLEIGKEIVKELEKLTIAKDAARQINIFQAGSWQEENMGDSYKVGQGVAGPNAHVHDNVFQQTWNQASGNINLNQLADELSKLREEMKKASSTPEQIVALGDVAAAEVAARKGDGPTTLQRLKAAGAWAFDIAKQIGVGVALEAAKSALGL